MHTYYILDAHVLTCKEEWYFSTCSLLQTCNGAGKGKISALNEYVYIALFSLATLPTQKEKGFPVNPGLHTQSKVPLDEVPLVEFTLMHRARAPHGKKSHGSGHIYEAQW